MASLPSDAVLTRLGQPSRRRLPRLTNGSTGMVRGPAPPGRAARTRQPRTPSFSVRASNSPQKKPRPQLESSREVDQLGCGRPAATMDRKGVIRRQPNGSISIPLAEARTFDQPGCSKLCIACTRAHAGTSARGPERIRPLKDAGGCRRRQDRVQKNDPALR